MQSFGFGRVRLREEVAADEHRDRVVREGGEPVVRVGHVAGIGAGGDLRGGAGRGAAALVAEPRATSDAAPIPTAAMLAANRLYC